jgi:type II secretory pathway pseudopilin PulG
MIKNEKGFTLIELMLATVIVVISIIPITMMLPRMLTENRMVERENRAVFLGQMKMEEVKTKALTYFNHLYSETGYFISPPNFDPTGYEPPDEMFYYKVEDDNDSNIKTIKVTVWYDSDNDAATDNAPDANEESIQFMTKVSNRGAN